MSQLHLLIGTECYPEKLLSALRELVEGLNAPAVGAQHVTCSDETEWECVAAFEHWFSARMLPALKSTNRQAFRSVNLGGRYEGGSLRVAEEHYALSETDSSFKVMVLKINSHAAVRPTPRGPEYGRLLRYDRESACCGALAALLEGNQLPAIRELADTFRLGEHDRLAALHDPSLVPIEHRMLAAAVVNARLQAQRAVADLQEHRPHSPTIFLILPCVTINRPGPDTELLVGQFAADWTQQEPEVKYHGLGDDPAAYRITHPRGQLRIEDPHWPIAE
ncbi:MAG: hypothetical protein JXB10_05115 [Pirellulales bacterium]|nr:hypothetical protein [Pirellulales bacterium]